MNSIQRTESTDIRLLTGIPRSGTTLCCRLINEVSNLIALHEPIDPGNLTSKDKVAAAAEINDVIVDIKQKITNGQPIPHGNKAGLLLDNPISQNINSTTRIRDLLAQRGDIVMAKPVTGFQLVVKQNALFAALVSELVEHYSMVAIVRNPIDTLASWMTVDLPVNQGRLPGGEKFDPRLADDLKNQTNTLQRQLRIYLWFVRQYLTSAIPIVKYEDIITTNGRALLQVFNLNHVPKKRLITPKRVFSTEVMTSLETVANSIHDDDMGGLYTSVDIQRAFLDLHRLKQGIEPG